jgi:CDP-diacylglycerol--glycerol-3-phosphate 3-phosphatidyltransferase
MKQLNDSIYNWPNLVSSLRILMAPVMIYLAFSQQPHWFIAVLLFSEFTDVLDGYLARRLNQVTELGSRLDSWGDFVTYTTLAISAWILWPDIVLQELYYFAAIIYSFTLPVIIGLIKFRAVVSYHTWSVKAAVAVTIVGYILLFSGLMEWPFRLAAVLCVYAALEETFITLIVRQPHVDVRSFWQALQLRRLDHG